jgi:hypothetical protein
MSARFSSSFNRSHGCNGSRWTFGRPGHQALEPRPDRAGAAQDELDPRVGGEAVRDCGEALEPLFLAHVAGVEHDHLIGVKTERAAKLAGLIDRPDRARVDPVREPAEPLCRQAGPGELAAHPLRDRRDQIEAPQQPAIADAQRPVQAATAEHAELAGRLELQVLDVEARPGTGKPRGEQRGRRGQGRRFDRPDHVGPPAQRLPERWRQAADREREQMQDALGRGRLARNPQRAAQRGGAGDDLPPVPATGIAAPDLPFRIVGRRGDHPHLMTALRQPGGEFTRVLADADQLRREVEAEQKDSHVSLPVGRVSALW